MRKQRLYILPLAFLLSLLIYIGSMAMIQPPGVSAHSYVIGSDPVDGTTIPSVPNVVRIFFNAPVSSVSRAHIYVIQNGQTREVSLAGSHIAPANPRELDTPISTPNAQPQGSYEVNWSAVANDDGHTTYGIIGFNVGFSSTGVSGVSTLGPSTSNNLSGPGGVRELDPLGMLTVAWEWMTLMALAAWIGILTVKYLLTMNIDRTGRILTLLDRAGKQTLSLQWLCLSTLFFSEIVTLFLRSIRLAQTLHGEPLAPTTLFSLLLETRYGLYWSMRIVLLLCCMSLLVWSSKVKRMPPLSDTAKILVTRSGPLRQQITGEIGARTTGNFSKDRQQKETLVFNPSSKITWLWFFLTGCILLTHVLAGESTNVLQPHMSALVLDWLDLAAQGVWFGGLTFLAFVLMPQLPNIKLDHHAEVLVVLLRNLAPLLLGCIGIALVSTLFLAEASLTSLAQLFSDPYGRVVLVQWIIFVCLLLCNGYTLFILRPRLVRQALLLPVVDADLPARRTRRCALEHGTRRLKLVASVQAVLGSALLLCIALLTFFSPPIVFPAATYHNPPAPPAHQTLVQTKQVGDLSASLQVLPGQVGQANTIAFILLDKEGKPVKDAQVTISVHMQAMDMGTEHATVKSGGPAYAVSFESGTAFSMTGVWIIDVRVQRPRQMPLQGTFQVSV